MSNLAIPEDDLPVVLPPNVARVTVNGLPTKHLIDWEFKTRYWYAVNVQALDQKLTVVESTIEDPETGISALARITEDLSTAVGLDGAEATKITSLEAAISDPSTGLEALADITEELSTAVGWNGAEATKITQLESAISDPSTGLDALASVTEDLSTAVGLTGSTSTKITSLESTVSGHTSTINSHTNSISSLSNITNSLSTAVGWNGSSATVLTALEASYNDISANGEIYFAAKSAPGGAAAAYGLFLSAGDAFAGMEILVDSGGDASIAMAASKLSFTDSGTAENVFNYAGGVFTFNAPVRVQTIDIAQSAVTSLIQAFDDDEDEIGNTGGWQTILETGSVTGGTGYAAVVTVGIEYKTSGTWSGTQNNRYRLRRSDGLILYSSSMQSYAAYAKFAHNVLNTSVTGIYTYQLQVNFDMFASSGGPPTWFVREKSILVDLRKR